MAKPPISGGGPLSGITLPASQPAGPRTKVPNARDSRCDNTKLAGSRATWAVHRATSRFSHTADPLSPLILSVLLADPRDGATAKVKPFRCGFTLQSGLPPVDLRVVLHPADHDTIDFDFYLWLHRHGAVHLIVRSGGLPRCGGTRAGGPAPWRTGVWPETGDAHSIRCLVQVRPRLFLNVK